MDINSLAESVGIDKIVVGGFLGAVLSLRFVDKSLGVLDRALLVLGGLAAAKYGTQLVQAFVDIKGGYMDGVSFFIGLYGMSLIDALYTPIRDGTLIAKIRGKVGL